jgi:hypothetical protein
VPGQSDDGVGAYPLDTQWSFYLRDSSYYRRAEHLMLVWETNGDSISDAHTPEDIGAEELFQMWVRWLETSDGWSETLGKPWVDLRWFVVMAPDNRGLEGAPFQVHALEPVMQNFLAFFTWPEHPTTGEPLNWLRLPVLDRLWRPGRGDRGGFISEATGWKPNALEAHMNVDLLLHARA